MSWCCIPAGADRLARSARDHVSSATRRDSSAATSGANPFRASSAYAFCRRLRGSPRASARTSPLQQPLRGPAIRVAAGLIRRRPPRPPRAGRRGPRRPRRDRPPSARSSRRSACSPRGRARSRDSTQAVANASSSRNPSSISRVIASSTSVVRKPAVVSRRRTSPTDRERASRYAAGGLDGPCRVLDRGPAAHAAPATADLRRERRRHHQRPPLRTASRPSARTRRARPPARTRARRTPSGRRTPAAADP